MKRLYCKLEKVGEVAVGAVLLLIAIFFCIFGFVTLAPVVNLTLQYEGHFQNHPVFDDVALAVTLHLVAFHPGAAHIFQRFAGTLDALAHRVFDGLIRSQRQIGGVQVVVHQACE